MPEALVTFVVAKKGLPKKAVDQGPLSDLKERYKRGLAAGWLAVYEVREVNLEE